MTVGFGVGAVGLGEGFVVGFGVGRGDGLGVGLFAVGFVASEDHSDNRSNRTNRPRAMADYTPITLSEFPVP